MPATSYYLQKAMTTLLDCVWDPTSQHASPLVFEAMNPLPPKDTPPQDLIGHVWKKPLEDLLQAEDFPPHMSDKARGHDFVETSSSLRAMIHTDECSWRCTVRHTDMLSTPPSFVEYRVQWQYNPHSHWGAGHKLPGHLPEVLRRALLMQNLCEWAVVALQNSVEMIAKNIDPDAEVLWMAVIPQRRFQLVFNDNGDFSTTHSVLLIRSPLAGNFVLDPTAEQYGIPREHRFLPWRIYKKRYIMSPGKWCGEAVWSTGTEAFMHGLEMSADWGFWEKVRGAIDRMVTAWLSSDDLKVAISDEGRWRMEGKLLERMVTEELC
ncbi:hypothetical protein EKO04_008026 [Ascochyta lentis]|uniref:Uncharacterized protein n=1 Tax=Ascochyta lentis TaxID=205686 RepID=A0A8H7J300_9PLEO|nr:hypothetical protein EKO04_008026 [Ascochyta lentis]